jgi:very-short-patch-repair endonuclease
MDNERLDTRIAAIAGAQHGLITSGQLEALGLSRPALTQRVEAGRLHRLRRGVYAVGHISLSLTAQRLAAVLACGNRAVASHTTAAAMWGLRQTSSPTHHVTAPAHPRSRHDIRVHRRALQDDDKSRRDGVPVTSLARTLVDLGDVVPAVQVRNALVRAEQARLLEMTAIERALARAKRTRGAAALREVLRVYDDRWQQTRSELELAFHDLIVANHLPEPEINAWIADRFLVDALWRRQRLIAEVDGETFHGTPSARRDDARRDRALRGHGFLVLRFGFREVIHQPGEVARRLGEALAGRRRSG